MTVRVDEYKERLCEEHNNPTPEPFKWTPEPFKWWHVLRGPQFYDCPPMPRLPVFIKIDAMTDGDLYGTAHEPRRPMVAGDLYPRCGYWGCPLCPR